MSDIVCRKCGEPWNSYGARDGEMTFTEYKRFMCGDGCPACNFGTICTQCRGTGREPAAFNGIECPECLGGRYLIIRANIDGDVWRYGYSPGIRILGYCRAVVKSSKTITMQDADGSNRREIRVIRHYSIKRTRDGSIIELMVACPYCRDSAPPCQWCKGTGEYHPHQEGEHIDEFLDSLMDGTDEDPLAYLGGGDLL